MYLTDYLIYAFLLLAGVLAGILLRMKSSYAIPYLAALQRSHKRNNDRRSTEENPAFTRNPQQTPM